MPIKELEGREYEASPLRAIRLKCMDCCCEQAKEVRQCQCTACAIWPFRMGRNPFRTRELSDEQKDELRERMAKARESRGS